MEIGIIDDTSKRITINYSNGKTLSLPYPNKQRIFPCGDKLDRPISDCRTSRKTLNKYKPVLIRFVPLHYKQNTAAYLPDNGGIYGSTGKPFGWSKEITNRLYYHANSNRDNPITETLAHFPPSRLSKYCKKDIPDTICDSIDWSVKAGYGKFIVKVTIADMTVNSKVDLSINDKSVISNIIPKGKIITIEKIIESKDMFITFSSNCLSNCDYSMTKINSVEIVPYIELRSNDDDSITQNLRNLSNGEKQEKELCGGSFENGKLYINI